MKKKKNLKLKRLLCKILNSAFLFPFIRLLKGFLQCVLFLVYCYRMGSELDLKNAGVGGKSVLKKKKSLCPTAEEEEKKKLCLFFF